MKSLFIGLVCAVMACAVQAKEITLRHALSGNALDTLATLTLKFNDTHKGKARVVLQDVNGVVESARGHLPELALLDTDDSLKFFGTRPRFLPLYQVMQGAGEALPSSSFYPQIADAVTDSGGRMQALPIGLSLPVLFWNKAAFKKAGLDPEKPPMTWAETQKVAGKLYDAEIECPLTSSNFAALHVENLSNQHGEPLLNGQGKQEKVKFNNLVNVKHLALLTSWYKSHYFRYFGPKREAEERFVSGECAMITGDSTLYKRLGDLTRYGVTSLPYHDDVRDATPKKVLPDGLAVWALAGKKKEEYKTAALFISFLMQPENQSAWVKATAFLPMGQGAIAALREAKAFSPELISMVEARLSTPHRNGERLHDALLRARMHGILDTEMDSMWAGRIPAKEALDVAMVKVNSPAAVVSAGKKSKSRKTAKSKH